MRNMKTIALIFAASLFAQSANIYVVTDAESRELRKAHADYRAAKAKLDESIKRIAAKRNCHGSVEFNAEFTAFIERPVSPAGTIFNCGANGCITPAVGSVENLVAR